jgi:hypothetical protein
MKGGRWRIAICLPLLSLARPAACAKARIVSVDPADPQPARKLRLSEEEWRELQSEFQKHRGGLIARDLKVLWWSRSAITNLVEVACVDPYSPSSGPVFFFRRDDGHWRILREMSVWDKKRQEYGGVSCRRLGVTVPCSHPGV